LEQNQKQEGDCNKAIISFFVATKQYKRMQRQFVAVAFFATKKPKPRRRRHAVAFFVVVKPKEKKASPSSLQQNQTKTKEGDGNLL